MAIALSLFHAIASGEVQTYTWRRSKSRFPNNAVPCVMELRALKFRFWSRNTDGVILAVLLAVLATGWLVYSRAWPEWRWQFEIKPMLIEMLETNGGPVLESQQDSVVAELNLHVESEGVLISSPVPMRVENERVEGDGFTLYLSKNFPDVETDEYFESVLAPLAVTKEDVMSACGTRERRKIQEVVVSRSLLFGGDSAALNFDRAVIVEGSHSTVVYWSGSRIIAGMVVANDRSDRRDFIIKFEGIARSQVEEIAAHLRFARHRVR